MELEIHFIYVSLQILDHSLPYSGSGGNPLGPLSVWYLELKISLAFITAASFLFDFSCVLKTRKKLSFLGDSNSQLLNLCRSFHHLNLPHCLNEKLPIHFSRICRSTNQRLKCHMRATFLCPLVKSRCADSLAIAAVVLTFQGESGRRGSKLC